MRYLMKRQLFQLNDDYIIRDERGRAAFCTTGRVMTFGDRLSFRDGAGRELAFVRQKLLAPGAVYELHYADELHSIITPAAYDATRCDISLDAPGPDDLQARGDLVHQEYAFTRDGRNVATVSRKWFRSTETYGVDVSGAEDDVLILASTVVIDLCCQEHSADLHAPALRRGRRMTWGGGRAPFRSGTAPAGEQAE